MPFHRASPRIVPMSPADVQRVELVRLAGLAREITDSLHTLSGLPPTVKGFMPGKPTAEMIGEVGAPCTKSELAEMYANGEISDEIIQEEARELNIRLA